jgi:ABC-2 type transport system permease protein
MNWRKIWLVARREYLFNFRRPSFLFAAIGVPALSLAAMFLIGKFVQNRETNLSKFQRVAYIDLAGIVDPALESTCDGCDFQPFVCPAPDSEPEACAAQETLAGNLDAFFTIDANYTLNGQVDLYARRSIPQALRDNVESFLREQIAARAPGNLAVSPDLISNADITIRDLDSGKELSEAALVGRLMLPFLFVMIYFMTTNTTAQFLMSGVVEEKENRLMEILATSLRPLELLWGKLLGLGALALTQAALWAIGGAAIVMINETAQEAVSGASFRAADIALMVALFLINFFVFSAAMLGIGASVTAETESRQVAGFFTLISVLPIMLLVTFFNNPDGPIPVIFTFFPLTAAVALTLRLGLTSLPTWQIALSMAIQVAAVFGVMWLAAKVFRLGMLMYGKSLTPRALWRALREGRTTLTTASTEYGPVQAKKKKRRGLLL